jgi:hypothetical protein
MTALINPSHAAIQSIASLVGKNQQDRPLAESFVQAVLTQISLEDFELQNQAAWTDILNSLFIASIVRTVGVSSIRINQDAEQPVNNPLSL